MRHLLLPLFLGSLDIISAIIAALVSIYLRFDGNLIPQNYLSMLVGQLPFFVMITIVSFFLFKLYSRVWRYAGSSELLAIVGANFAGAICWFIFSVLVEAVLPRSIYILTALVLTFFVGGTRLSLRVYSYLTSKPQYIQRTQKLNKVLVIGAGDAGAMLAREIERYHSGKRKIIGFIDDDRDKQGKTMFGIRVLGSRYDIEQVVADTDANEIIIAMPSVKGKEIKEIIDVCKNTNCKLTILPGVYEIIEGTVSVNQLRPVEVEDLLGRDPVKLDTKNVSAYITGKVVLITGAGGSIGSEICRQVAKMQPQKMLLLGNVYPKNLEETLYLFGENGTVKIGGTSTNNIDVWDFSDNCAEDKENKGLTEVTSNVYGNGHTILFADMIEAIKNNRQPYVDAYAGKNALELVLAIYQSAAQGKPVQLPLKNCNTMDFVGRFENE